jgi:hypothetical protein
MNFSKIKNPKLELACNTILTINIDNELLTPCENQVQININLFYAVINSEKG